MASLSLCPPCFCGWDFGFDLRKETQSFLFD